VNSQLVMIDLGAGLKAASQAMRDRGWKVITVDINPAFQCDETADVRTWKYGGGWQHVDLLWFSMPCDEYSREFMPWSKTGQPPDMSLVLACLRLRDEIRPTYWICENTKGAISWFRPYMGNYRFHAVPFYLWGFFPKPARVDMRTWRKKESYSSTAHVERAAIPYSLSHSIAVAIEQQAPLPMKTFGAAS
jgi:site-specific DNA-cytosine methylase